MNVVLASQGRRLATTPHSHLVGQSRQGQPVAHTAALHLLDSSGSFARGRNRTHTRLAPLGVPTVTGTGAGDPALPQARSAIIGPRFRRLRRQGPGGCHGRSHGRCPSSRRPPLRTSSDDVRLRDAAMTLSPGIRLGPYEITARIGAGGQPPLRSKETELRRGLAEAKPGRTR